MARANSTMMAGETRLERWFDRVAVRATTPRGAIILIATAATTMTVVAGMPMTVADHDNFPTIGSGLWWSAQTVMTVGYGDHVPTTVAGQLVATLVMLLGIGLLMVIIAFITSTFVSRSRREQTAGAPAARAEQLRQINERIERVEAAMARRPQRS